MPGRIQVQDALLGSVIESANAKSCQLACRVLEVVTDEVEAGLLRVFSVVPAWWVTA